MDTDDTDRLLAYLQAQDEAATERRRTRNRIASLVCAAIAVIAACTFAWYQSGAEQRAIDKRSDEITCHLLGRDDC